DGSARAPKRGAWKKLLWVKQAYPDNYTDELQFLSHLQRNPTLRPYEFWPLVADSTIIVQHVASVIIFVCCFVGIFKERVSPVSVVSWATIGTVLGWVARDWWIGREEEQRLEEELRAAASKLADAAGTPEASDTSTPLPGAATPSSDSLGISFHHPPSTRGVSRGPSPDWPSLPDLTTGHPSGAPTFATYSHYPPYENRTSRFSPRNQERLATAKSAILIYCALLGLSPILKSLTKSTSPDSIWAMSSWLISINVFTFDYGAGVEAKFPAPLSTNAALMASTVLASRLPSTTHVFSLTLFSIEVFGLFPVFRRLLRHVSWVGHLVLTGGLIVGAGGGLCVIITGGAWKAATVGVVLGGLLTCLAMGMTSWWLIGLQRFKDEIRGPWDPARPVIRRRWD
ncbi:phosphatidylinositol N-acetylglucosaminyltransferase, partial [Myriangium duriaei CBS 260.36]